MDVECSQCGQYYEGGYKQDQMSTVITQLAMMQKQLNELHQFAKQLAESVEQFQSGGMGKMIAGMMGGKRNG